MLARIQKVDLSKPGAVADLLAFHRRTFGAARMEEGDGKTGDGKTGDGKTGDGKTGDGKTGDGKTGDGKTGDGKTGDGKAGDGDDEGEALAAQFAEARTGRKAAEKAISELTGKSITQVRRAFKDANGDALKAVAALTDGDGKTGDGKAGDGKTGDGKTGDGKTGDGKTDDAAKVRLAAEATDAKLVRAGVRVLAADTFIDPADALHKLDLSDYEVDDDGELLETDKVKADLAQVLKDNPRYAKKQGPKSDRSQGRSGGKGDRPKSMRELSRMDVDRKDS